MPKSILAHIASGFIPEYENVANSSIAYLLNEYPVSHNALKSVLDLDEVPTYYETERATESNGRPDVTGFNVNFEKAVIIEGKFWANLTDNQPGNYLDELTENGKILFLAPEKRRESLLLEIEKKLNGEDDRVVVCSWNKFLDLIEIENNKSHNHHLASDLNQIKELCQQMDAVGMPPLSESDLDPMNGRVASQFSDVVQECNSMIREWNHSDFSGLNATSTMYGYGFSFRVYNFGCFLSFDSRKWFAMATHTPIWLSIKEMPDTGAWKMSSKINHALNNFDSENSYDDEYGISLKSGWDKNQVVKHIVDRTNKILEYLNDRIAIE